MRLMMLLSLLSSAAPAAWAAPDGKHLYASYCAHCHGAGGSGGRGPAVTGNRLPRAVDERAFVEIVQLGIPNTEMPMSRLSVDEVLAVRQYLVSAGLKAEPPRGDAVRGKSVYQANGCAQCHMISGVGGRLGPELTSIGLHRSAGRLRQSIVKPDAEVPNNFAQYRLVIPFPDNFLMVRVKTRDGREIEGMRINEDPVSIQIRDMRDGLHSFEKAELASIERLAGRTPMPSYAGKLTETELEDVVAYLQGTRR